MKFATEAVISRNRLLTTLFVLLSIYSQAQCIKRAELLALANSSLLKPDHAIQIKGLSSVLGNWERCQYLKDSSYVNIMLERAKTRSFIGDYKTAIQEIEQTLRLYTQPHPYLKEEDQVKAYYRLGFYWKGLNEFEKSIEASENALKLGEHLPANQWVSFAYTTLAYAHYSAGEFQKAVENAERGIFQAKRINNITAYLENSGEKIKALIALSANEEAEKELADAIVVARKSKTTSYMLAFFLVYKARIEKKHLNRKNALTCYREALQINILNKSVNSIIENYNDIGYLFHQAKDYDKALENYYAALAMTSDQYLKLLLLSNIGEVYWQKKQYNTALRYYQMGLNSIAPGFSKRPVTKLPDARFIRIVSQKEYLLTLMQNKADTWLDSARVTNSRPALLNALATYEVADQMIDFMRWEHTGQLSKLYWREHTRGMYERAIETCFRLKNTEQAFHFFEKSRAAMLADKLNELGARQQLSRRQATEEQRLQREVSSQQAELANLKNGTAAYDSALVEVGKRQRNLDDFLKKLEVSNPAYYRYKYDTTVTSLATLRHHLKTQKASFVTYFVGDSTLYVLGLTADTTMMFSQPLQRYGQNMQAFMKLLNDPDAMNRKANLDQFLSLGNGMYHQLLAPLKLPAGRVIVSPDGSFVPFETLSRKANETDYLVDNYAFSYTYSARFILKKYSENRTGMNVRQGSFLGMAPVEFAPKLNQVTLPGSEKALQRIAERFPSPMLLTHGKATRQAFLKEASTAGVIQLFTHATADSSGQEPMLYFADSALKLSDLGDGNLPNAQLVVLAACKTGIGAVQRGEGVFSLARGFAALGVPSVLTTLWSVQNQATYELTDLFYKYVDEGLPKDLALQQAKKDWLRTSSQTNRLPNFWAGLIIVGDTEPLEQTNYGLWIAVVSLLTLAGIGGWVWQQQKQRAKRSVSWPHSV